MDKRRQMRFSKFLSYVLRHRPEQIGIKLDKAGWADVPELLREANRHGISITPDELETDSATMLKLPITSLPSQRKETASDGKNT